MEDIYYLLHKTKHYNKEDWKELKTSSIDNSDDQFPGVYLTPITKYNIRSAKLYPGKYVLIFSRKLLNQKNYHINILDNNGMITETNTYYPWNIKDAVDKIASITEENKKSDNDDVIVKTNNEVVFHDPISMNYCCDSITIPSGLEIVGLPESNQTYYRFNGYLPKKQIKNDLGPDKSKKPFYCYPQLEEKCYKEDNTKLDETLSSSNQFLKTIASVCNIKTGTDTLNKKIIDEIKTKMGYLYLNRGKQNIQALIEFTNKEKEKRIGGSKGKIKSKTKRKVKRKTKRVKKRKRTRTIKRKQK